MKIQLWSIGKVNDANLNAAIEDYTKRIGRYFPVQWKIISPPKNAAGASEVELKKKEAEIVNGMLSREDNLIVLDEHGKSLSSVKLAGLLQQRANESAKQLIFLVGGAYGIDQSLVARAVFSWSLSELTFPHQLVRLILAEQLYRACTIIRNEKYHHA